MKKIFLTGGTGLLGKKFLEETSMNEFEIVLGKRTTENVDGKLECKYFKMGNVYK